MDDSQATFPKRSPWLFLVMTKAPLVPTGAHPIGPIQRASAEQHSAIGSLYSAALAPDAENPLAAPALNDE